jgi:hypothetical protein
MLAEAEVDLWLLVDLVVVVMLEIERQEALTLAVADVVVEQTVFLD